MMPNIDFAKASPVEKGMILYADVAPNGVLPQEVERKFIVLAIKGSKMLQEVRREEMGASEKRLPKIQMNDDVMGPGVAGQAVTANQYARPDFTATTLVSKLFKGAVQIPDEIYEDNVELEGLRSTVEALVAEKVGENWEDLSLNGDTTSARFLLQQFDGWIKQITSHITAVGGGSGLARQVMKDMFLSIPVEKRRHKGKLSYYTSTDAEFHYRDSLADRATPEGDKRLIADGGPVFYSGMPVKDIPLMPYELGGSQDQTVVLLGDPKNFVVGVQRGIKIERERKAATSSDTWYISMRVDAKIIDEDAVAKATGVTN